MESISRVGGRLRIGADWVAGTGAAWTSRGPADDQAVWAGRFASHSQIRDAIGAAAAAFPIWSESSLEHRISVCKRFSEVVALARDELASLIARETGKPLWEANTEVGTVIAKIANSIDAILARRWTTTERIGELLAVTRFRPHGVLLVLGPFNLPAHLPGSHIVPALLAGNTLVFKPSELTPAVGQWLVEAWEEAGLPAGALNLIHGSREEAECAIADSRLAGVLFTGSRRAGEGIHRGFAGQPHKVLALEMGGNNPLVVHECSNLDAVALTIIQSAFITSGQRCTCARRLILTDRSKPEKLIARLVELIPKIRVGLPFDQSQPFMGPLIHADAATRMLEVQAKLEANGARILVSMRQGESRGMDSASEQTRSISSILPISPIAPISPIGKLADHSDPTHQARVIPRAFAASCGALLSPGLVDATGVELADEEYFGPLLTIHRAADFDSAIALANATRYGLAAGLISEKVEHFHYFLHRARAGVINWNRQTTGASGRLPFGGVGASGNHCPSGFFAADYCSYPVASLESHALDESLKGVSGLEEVMRACSLK